MYTFLHRAGVPLLDFKDFVLATSERLKGASLAEAREHERPIRHLALFPEGLYTFEGRSEDGERVRTQARFSHRIPGAPHILTPQEGVPQDRTNTVIDWEPVTSPAGVEIAGYEVIVVGDGIIEMSVKVPAWLTHLRVPSEILRPGREYGFEVLAIEKNGNQTIFEGSFETAD